jgi:hypothetical protein
MANMGILSFAGVKRSMGFRVLGCDEVLVALSNFSSSSLLSSLLLSSLFFCFWFALELPLYFGVHLT